MTGVSLSDPSPTPAGGGQGNPGSATPTPAPAPSGNPGTGTGSPGTPPTGGENANWYSTYQDEGIRKFAETKGWKDPEAALKSHMELEKAFSSKAPSAPKDASGYQLEPLQLNEGIEVNKELDSAFKSMALKAGMSNEQANTFYKEYGSFMNTHHTAMVKAQETALNEKVTNSVKDLEAAFQSKMGSEVFNRNVEMAKRAIRLLDTKLVDELRNTGVITNVNGQDTVTNATIFKVLAKVGSTMFAEDALYGAPAENTNPFDPKTMDMQAQGYLIKNDPEKAKLLIRSLPSDQQEMWREFLNR